MYKMLRLGIALMSALSACSSETQTQTPPGADMACAAGTACIPQNRCHRGTIDCSTGAPLCQDTGALAGMDPGCGPLAYWPFDGTGADVAGGRDVQLVGSPAFATGLFGQALDLKGDSRTYAVRRQGTQDIDDDAFNLVDTDFTIQAWLAYHRTDTEQQIIEKFVGRNGPGWTCTKLANNSFHACLVQGPCAELTAAPVAVPSEKWVQVILRRDTSFTLFFNGQRIAESPAMKMAATTVPLLIGRRNETDGRPFPLNGRIDEVAIWKRALTADEITFLYNSGTGRRASEVN